MSKKLGKIEKPSLERFNEGRKLFCVPLLPYIINEDFPKDYHEKVSLYWKQVYEQVNNLEKVGKISKVFHESITISDEEAMESIKRMNEMSFELVKIKCEAGAILQIIEDKNLLNEYLDWSICLSVVGRSQNVFKKIIDFQGETAKKREEYISNKINEMLKENETGLLIMSDENRMRIQPMLSSDIQVFLVRPPALNDIQRWIRDFMFNRMKEKYGN